MQCLDDFSFSDLILFRESKIQSVCRQWWSSFIPDHKCPLILPVSKSILLFWILVTFCMTCHLTNTTVICKEASVANVTVSTLLVILHRREPWVLFFPWFLVVAVSWHFFNLGPKKMVKHINRVLVITFLEDYIHHLKALKNMKGP